MIDKVTLEIAGHIAKLAALKFSPEDLKVYSEKFAHVLEYVEKLSRVETKGVEPTSHALEVVCNMRDDIVKKFDGTDGILNSTPERDGRYVQVPKVIG